MLIFFFLLFQVSNILLMLAISARSGRYFILKILYYIIWIEIKNQRNFFLI